MISVFVSLKERVGSVGEKGKVFPSLQLLAVTANRMLVSDLKVFRCTVLLAMSKNITARGTRKAKSQPAYRYLTAAVAPEKVKATGNTLIYAAVAIVVVLFARGLPLIIDSLFTGGTGVAC